MAAIGLRLDFDAAGLRRLAAGDGDRVRRLLALALIQDGKSRVEVGRLVGMDRQISCDRVHRFNAGGLDFNAGGPDFNAGSPDFNTGGPDGLANRPAPGAARRLTAEQEAAFMALVEAGPAAADPEGLARWRRGDLAAQIKAVGCHPSPAHG